MSRSGFYEYDGWNASDQWRLICCRGAVASAIRGKRGQAFLKELLAVLEAMPDKKLIEGDLVTPQGEVCAIGSICVARGIDLTDIEIEDYESIAHVLGIAPMLVQEIEFTNDESYFGSDEETNARHRWRVMRDWVKNRIKEDVAA